MAFHQVVIRLEYEKALGKICRYDGQIVWRKDRRGPKCDRLKIAGKRIELTCVRSRRIRPGEAINSITMRSLRSVALYVAALEGRLPTLRSISVLADDGTSITYQHGCEGLPARLFEWEYECKRGYDGSLLAPPGVARMLFLQTQTAKATRVSISYMLGAAQSVSEDDRLRYLWSAYNPLYQLYYLLEKGKVETRDSACLNLLSKRVIGQRIRLERSEALFAQMDQERMGEGVNWGFVESERKKREKEQDRGEMTESKGHKKSYMTKDMYLNSVPQQQRLSFLINRYLYFCRCTSMHGNVGYSIFSLKRSDEGLHELCDLLTLCIFDLIEICEKLETD